MSNEKIFGERLAELREKKKISRVELAEVLMVTPQAVGKWERGESMPDILSLKKIADILQTNMEAFFEKEEFEKEDEFNNQTGNCYKEKEDKSAWNFSMSNWVDADFSGLKDVADKFNFCNISKCNLSRAKLNGISFKANTIRGCDFSNADLSQSKLNLCDIQKNNFSNTLFKGSIFSNCTLVENNFSDSDLSGVKFSFGLINKGDFKNANLKGIDFNRILISNLEIENDITDCSFSNCRLKNIVFKNIKFTNTFFKNHKHKQCSFINCTADNISYSFLVNSKIDLTGLSLIQ